MTALYKIANEYQQAFNELSANDALSAEIVADTLSGIEVEFEQKAIAIAAMILNMEAEAKAIKSAEENMNARRKAVEGKVDSMKEYLINNLHVFKKTSILTPEFDIKIKKCPASVHVDPTVTLPDEFMRVKPAPEPEPDKAKIKQALTEGKEVKGCVLINNSRLEIK